MLSDYEVKYMQKVALNLVPRIEEAIKARNLENIFLSKKFEAYEAESVFIANENMDNERLRELIEEINSCRFIEDKILIIKREVKSLDDLVEILNNCIWEDELVELIDSLSKEEVEVLKYYLKNRTNSNESNTGWEKNLIIMCELE